MWHERIGTETGFRLDGPDGGTEKGRGSRRPKRFYGIRTGKTNGRTGRGEAVDYGCRWNSAARGSGHAEEGRREGTDRHWLVRGGLFWRLFFPPETSPIAPRSRARSNDRAGTTIGRQVGSLVPVSDGGRTSQDVSMNSTGGTGGDCGGARRSPRCRR